MLQLKNIANYMECSAKTGDNVDHIFEMLVKDIHYNIKKHKSFKKCNYVKKTINLLEKNNKTKNICCYYF